MQRLFPILIIAGISVLNGCILNDEPEPLPRDAESLLKITVGKYPSISPDGTMMAFSRNGAIFISDTNGSNAIQLTNGNYTDIIPLWSPDGKKIGFIRKSNRESTYGRLMWVDSMAKSVYTISFDDSVYCQLESIKEPYGDMGSNRYVGTPFWNWSPDGNSVAFYSGNDTLTTLSIMNSDGSGSIIHKLPMYTYHNFDYWGNYSGFCWLPPGNQIIFVSNVYTDTSYLYKLSVGIDSPVRVSDKKVISNPSCSSDGRLIGFYSHDYAAGGYHIVDVATGFTSTFHSVWYSPKLTPNGKKIISYSYSRNSNPDANTYTQLNCTDVSTGLRSFLVQSDWDYNFVFHPSSQWVYLSRSGVIYRADIPR